MSERRLQGEAASPGLAIGPLLRLADLMASQGPSATAGNPEAARRQLADAMEKARAELQALAAGTDPATAEILEFQIEMLADPSLVEEALIAVDMGASAADAWRDALDSQILGYTEADDDYFRARSADLGDLRDRVLQLLANVAADPTGPTGAGAILLARDIGPSRFLGLDWTQVGGVALEAGSRTSHVAMLARARGVPLVTGLGDVFGLECDAILDAAAGTLILDPTKSTRQHYEREVEAAAARAEAEREMRGPVLLPSGDRVFVLLNVDDPAALDQRLLDNADGIGLMRTEFLFIGRDRLPDEETQYRAYADLLRRAGGKPVTIRTLDVGGDKPLPGISLPEESNPFLGLRGIRLCLEQPELFRPQVRALLRAAASAPLKVMLPMITHPDELKEAIAIFGAELAALREAGVETAMPELGIMIEVPAAAIAIERFPQAAFYSIGSNDLVQYVMAASRDLSGRVARLADATDPAVMALVEHVMACAMDAHKEVSVCGDMAADAAGLAALLNLGMRRISIAPAALGRVKTAIAAHG